MKTRDIMAAPAVTVPPQARIGETAKLMLDHDLAGLPVLDASGKLLGLVTETDLVVKHAHIHVPTYLGILGGILPFETHRADEDVRRALAVTAQEVMTRHPVTISAEADVEDAATLMVEEGLDAIPVLEDDRLVGIVSRRDMIRLLVVEEADVDQPSLGRQ